AIPSKDSDVVGIGICRRQVQDTVAGKVTGNNSERSIPNEVVPRAPKSSIANSQENGYRIGVPIGDGQVGNAVAVEVSYGHGECLGSLLSCGQGLKGWNGAI